MGMPSPDGSLRTTSARAAFLPHLQTIYCNWWDAEEPRNSSGEWRVTSGEKKNRAPGRAGINSTRPLQKSGGRAKEQQWRVAGGEWREKEPGSHGRIQIRAACRKRDKGRQSGRPGQ